VFPENRGCGQENTVKRTHYYSLTLSQSVYTAVILLGAFAACMRRLEGWGSWTRLKEIFPWGLCSGLDVFCGLGLAAGGFAIAAVLYLSKLEIYRPILRSSMLVAFIGFLLATLATTANRPFHYWSFATLWSPRGAYFGPVSALVLYSALLFVEFIPDKGRKAGRQPALLMLRLAAAFLAVLAAVLAISQQLVLSRLLLISPGRFSPLWLTPMLPAHMFLSSVVACLALIVFASGRISFSSERKIPPQLSATVAKTMAILLPLYVILRFLDLFDSPAFPFLFNSQPCNYYLGIELCLFLLPTLLLLRQHEACSARTLDISAALVIGGFMVNRLNLSITSREAVAGILYVPRWTDVMIAAGAIAVCVVLYSLAVRYLDVFSQTTSPNSDRPIRPEFPQVA
jgi:Ni/Fe-hydrogenase subunit HybB-like protein